jgi:hypothetical protein
MNESLSDISLPSRNKDDIDLWVRQLKDIRFKLIDEFLIEEEVNELVILMIRNINYITAKIESFGYYSTDPSIWIDEVIENFRIIQDMLKENLGYRKELLIKSLNSLDKYLAEAKAYFSGEKFTNNAIISFNYSVKKFQQSLSGVRTWLQEGEKDRTKISLLIQNKQLVLENFHKYIISQPTTKSRNIDSEAFNKFLHTNFRFDPKQLVDSIEVEISQLQDQLDELTRKYIKKQNRGVPVKMLPRANFTKALMFNKNRIRTLDEVPDLIDKYNNQIRRFISENQIIDLPEYSIKTVWSPYMTERYNLMKSYSNSRGTNFEITVYLSEDIFNRFINVKSTNFNNYRLLIALIEHVMPGKEMFKHYCEAMIRRNFNFSNPLEALAWGKVLLKIMLEMDFRSGEIELEIMNIFHQLEFLATTRAQLGYLLEDWKNEDIFLYLLERAYIDFRYSETYIDQIVNSYADLIYIYQMEKIYQQKLDLDSQKLLKGRVIKQISKLINSLTVEKLG